MFAGELVTTDFPVLKPDDPLHKAVDFFLDFCICHVPVVSENGLEGVLPVDLLMDIPDRGKLISDFKNDFIHVCVYMDQHGLDIFEIMARHELTAIPVLDENQHYIGCISSNTLMKKLSEFYSFKQAGGIIDLSVGIRDYSLSEISRIVESNNAKILVVYLETDEENAMFKITLKIDTLDLSHIRATFERFKYVVTYSYPANEQKDELKDRYDLLMKMFDI